MTPLFGLSVFHLQWFHFFWPTLFFLTRSTLGTISLGYASCEWILLFKACHTLLTMYFGCTYSPLKLNMRLYQTRMHAAITELGKSPILQTVNGWRLSKLTVRFDKKKFISLDPRFVDLDPVGDFDSCFHLCCEAYVARRSYPVSSAAMQRVERPLKHDESSRK